MTSKQHAVLWLGFILIAVRLFTTDQWKIIWGTLTSSDGSQGGSKQQSTGSKVKGALTDPLGLGRAADPLGLLPKVADPLGLIP